MSKSRQIQAPHQTARQAKLVKLDKLIAISHKVDCDHPKPEDVEQLRQVLKGDPSLWQIIGDLMKQAQLKTLEGVDWGNGRALVIESVKAGTDHIRHELGYAHAPMLEKLLIEQCVTAWLRLSVCEFRYSRNTTGPRMRTDLDYWDKALTAAQRRYLRAIESLARVRRLRLPVLQVNVAEPGARQLNVANSGTVGQGVKGMPQNDDEGDSA